MGFAVLSASSSCAKSSFFSASETDLSALIAAISFLICSGGSVNFLVRRVDPRHDHRDIRRHDVVVGKARKAVPLGDRVSLSLRLRIRLVEIRAVVELRHVLVGAHEALNLLLRELDLFYLLRGGRAGMKRSQSQNRREQHT